MKSDYSDIENNLHNIVDGEGIDFLSRSPMKAYKKLVSYDGADIRMCRCVLMALMAGVVEQVEELGCRDIRGYKGDIENAQVYNQGSQYKDELSKWIQRECCFKKRIADAIADIFTDLLSKDNKDKWSEMFEEGFRELCNLDEWEYSFDGEHTWHHQGGSEDCYVSIKASFAVKDDEKLKHYEPISKALSRNPFLDVDAIFEIISKELDGRLQRDMEEYCEAETYYEPYLEDYDDNGEDVVKRFCDELGLEMLYYECDGSESGFEPDFDRW